MLAGRSSSGLSMRTLLVLQTCLPLFIFFQAVHSYSFDKWAANYTEAEMKDLVKFQQELQDGLKTVTKSSGFRLIAHCGCSVDDSRGGHDERVYCSCCLGFGFRSKEYSACIEGGIKSNPSSLFLSLKIGSNQWTFTFEPEICVSFPSFWFVKFCIGIYHHNLCLDYNDLAMSAFKLCFQADIVVLIPILTIDFNCIHYHDKRLEIDSSMHSARAGLITYKVGHGIRGISKSTGDDANTTEFIIGDLSLMRGKLGVLGKQNKNNNCKRLDAYRRVCGPNASAYKKTFAELPSLEED